MAQVAARERKGMVERNKPELRFSAQCAKKTRRGGATPQYAAPLPVAGGPDPVPSIEIKSLRGSRAYFHDRGLAAKEACSLPLPLCSVGRVCHQASETQSLCSCVQCVTG